MSELTEIKWPANLIEEIAFNRCVFFIGSGVSSTSTSKEGERMKGWEEFIKSASSSLLSNENQSLVNNEIRKKNYLRALEIVKRRSDIGAYTRFLSEEFSRKHYEPSVAHEIIKSLNMKIMVTTNFDSVLDNHCKSNNGDYVVINYSNSEDILTHIKSYNNVIVKAHGTIDSPDKIIFTESDYLNSMKNNGLFYKILESLFITHTVLFLGYSMNDPDIQLLLNNEANTSSKSSPHYILMTDDLDPLDEELWSNQYNISTIKYGADHNEFLPMLEELREKVMEIREKYGLEPWLT